jgi:hypothetical protein
LRRNEAQGAWHDRVRDRAAVLAGFGFLADAALNLEFARVEGSVDAHGSGSAPAGSLAGGRAWD